MSSKALGLIEVKGLLSSITATDAALKAADVRLINKQTIRGGLTTVELFGDVAAIKSAVEAGVDALSNTDSLISSHVIARIDEQVEQMIMREFERKKEKQAYSEAVQLDNITEESKEEESENLELPEDSNVITHDEETNQEIEEANEAQTEEATDQEIKTYTEDELRSMKVTQLRSMAYNSNEIGIEKAQIKYANKEKLVEALRSEGGID